MKTILHTISTFIFLGYATAGALEKTEISFAFIGATDSSAYKGVAQGIHEANLQGQFLSQSYSLTEFTGENIDAIDPDEFIAIIVATEYRRPAAGRRSFQGSCNPQCERTR